MTEHDYDNCPILWGECEDCDAIEIAMTQDRPPEEWDTDILMRILARRRPDKWGAAYDEMKAE